MRECGKKSNSVIKKLGYTFNNNNLLKIALTHSSHKGENNQRLEFLGDAILNVIIAEYLYNQHPAATEGDLTRLRSNLVNENALSSIARNYSIQSCIVLGLGEIKTDGCNKNSILADTLEAIIAAIYLDSDFSTIKELIMNWYSSCNYLQSIRNIDPNIDKLDNHGFYGSKDSKTILQELLQSKGLTLPRYEIIKVSGKPHHQTFKISCIVPGINKEIHGVGTSRKKAEQDAANKILELLL